MKHVDSKTKGVLHNLQALVMILRIPKVDLVVGEKGFIFCDLLLPCYNSVYKQLTI